MILEYGLRNFLSFRDGVSLSFRLDANCPPQISQGREFATVMCVKGANGSGKTQLLKGLAFVSDFVVKSFARDPDEKTRVDSFYESTLPSEFFVEFEVSNDLYRYELAITPERVLREALFRTHKKRVRLFERNGETISHSTKAFDALKTMRLRANASAISTARQYDFVPLEPVSDFFSGIVSNVGYAGHRERTFLDIDQASELFHKSPDYLQFAADFIKSCDIGITNIKIIEYESPKATAGDGDKERKAYAPVFLHSVGSENKPVFSLTESSGTKQLFRNLLAYKLVLNQGGVLVLDEADAYLHPHILPRLIDLFDSPETNPKSAQLLFSSHSVEVLDFTGRYKTYLVNKEENVSYAYRLDEIPGDVLRNDRSIIPAYREGRIGGVPRPVVQSAD